MRSINIQAFTLALSQEEIRGNISQAVIDSIKSKGENPYFRAYSVIHEGMSKPRVLGEGYEKISWPRTAIESVKHRIKAGLQFFVGHNNDSSVNGRKSIGRVITDFPKVIGGVLHHIVVGHFPDKNEASQYDVCSIEAIVDFVRGQAGTIARKIDRITGIALGNSNNDHPAFPGAVVLASLQAFGPDDEKRKKIIIRKEIPMITFEDVKRKVQEMNIWPHQLFDETKMIEDVKFGKFIKENNSFKEKVTSLEDLIKQKDAEIVSASKMSSVATAKARFEKLIPEGSTAKQKEFYLKKFQPEAMTDLTDEGLKSFIEKSQLEYKDFAALFGGKTEDTNIGNKGSDTDNSTPENETTEEKLNRLVAESASE